MNIKLPEWDADDVCIAMQAAHEMADHFQCPVVVLDDLSVKLKKHWHSTERVMEVIRPRFEREGA